MQKTVKKVMQYKFMYLFILPAIIWYILFKYVPMYGVIIAFKDYTISKGIMGSPWVGLKYFKKMFDNEDFLRVLRNTIVISLLRTIFVFGSGIAMALMLNEIKPNHARFKKGIQIVTYLPHFFSWVIIASIMTELLAPSRGVVNELITALGGTPIYFLANTKTFIPVLIVSDIWQSCGWGSIIFLAAISSIDPQLYEAAYMDGANRFTQMYHITIPSIMNVIVIMLIMNLGKVLDGGFDQIFNLYNVRVYSVADIIDTYVYRMGMEQMQYSYSSAVGLFKNLVGLGLVLITNTIAKKFDQQGLW